MRVVVLHGHYRPAPGVPPRPRGGGIAGVHIAGDHVGLLIGHERQVIQRRLETLLGARVGHIAKVGGQVRMTISAHQTEGGLEITTGGQDDLAVDGGHRDRQRRVSPRSAQRHLPALVVDGDHGILTGDVYRPIMA